jgi:Fur family transcriptional regulator, stress-responsive regulator
VLPDPATTLRAHQVQVTAQRLAVLRAVMRWPHAAADKIADEVRAEIGAISRQAVYDALAMLTEKGIVRRIQPAGSPALFDPRVGDSHHHVICRVCAAVVDVDCAKNIALCLAPPPDTDYVIDEAEVLYWGTCPKCRAEKVTAEERV